MHMGMRPYDPQSGRFMALDPLWLAGGAANMFAYAAGDPIQRSDPVGLVSGSFGVCEGVCIGVKPAITSKGISFCVEFGFGSGGGVEVTPGGDLDDNKAYVKAEGSLNAGPVGLDVTTEASSDGNCKSTKTSAKFCLMGVCVDSEDGLTGDPKGPIDALGKMLHLGAEGKIAAGVCQQAKW